MPASTRPRDSSTSPIRRILREPLLQFLALGGLLFVTAHGFAEHRDNVARQIVVDPALTQRLTNQYESQTGTLPSPERLNALVDEHVREEVLYREALKLGLDQNDEIVRRRLTQKLDFLQRDLSVVAEPDDTQLQAYYRDHIADFTEPATVSFTHVYFSPDQGGSDAAHKRARAALARVAGKDGDDARKLGDTFPLQDDYAALNHEDAVQLFGQTPIVDGLFAAAQQEWSGPFPSGYGWHLVRVTRRTEATPLAFERVRDRTRTAWLQQARSEANARNFETLKANYQVVRSTTEPKS
ncbi:peptidyl-prolyl cis-trans isomerase [Aromatoleum toluclasticum]|uniref:peptidylprolyl isomerase n=1 Tax=Aromatoleum toluclasticum TaxID=92003 RepID=UPI001D17DC45|nr:peptidylprolyl isomerase [Aromatoleum toluclasticum]MCC4116865.1 peptidyl-prolyl cis-trans isomerase [Aromatoleum toluclasticum]